MYHFLGDEDYSSDEEILYNDSAWEGVKMRGKHSWPDTPSTGTQLDRVKIAG